MAKKSFNPNIEEQLQNPETAFISTAVIEEPKEAPEAPVLPLGYVIRKETKSKKTQIAMQPSLFNAVRELAVKEGESFNEMLHILLREALENHK